MQNVLIVGAHYDDVELGVGGTARRLIENGCTVYKLTLTDNVTKSTDLKLNIDYESSKINSAQACAILGIKELLEFSPVDCCYLQYTTEIMQRVETLLYKYKIDTVFMHYKEDLNQDHVAASQICVTAARHCDNIIAYQSNMYSFNTLFAPTIFVDISQQIHTKKEALSKYGEQHNRFGTLFEATIQKNAVWGYSHNTPYVEAFQAIKVLI